MTNFGLLLIKKRLKSFGVIFLSQFLINKYINVVNKFNKLIEISYALYDKSSDKRCQHFSFILFKNRIISIGQNSVKTHPINIRNSVVGRDGSDLRHIKTTCSELAALIKLKNTTNIRYKKCVMVNVRIDRNKKINYSHPCAFCQSLLAYFNLKQVFFTNSFGKFEEYL